MPRDLKSRRIVSLYVVAEHAAGGDRGLLGDSPADLVRVAEAWQNTPAAIVARRARRKRPVLRALTEGRRAPSDP